MDEKLRAEVDALALEARLCRHWAETAQDDAELVWRQRCAWAFGAGATLACLVWAVLT